MTDLYHATHEAKTWETDYTCITCVTGAVLAQLDDLATVDAASVLEDVLAQLAER